MDTLLSNRALGYLSMLLILIAVFFTLIEFFVTALSILVFTAVIVAALWLWRLSRQRRQSSP